MKKKIEGVYHSGELSFQPKRHILGQKLQELTWNLNQEFV
jgi:hypothetical protein